MTFFPVVSVWRERKIFPANTKGYPPDCDEDLIRHGARYLQIADLVEEGIPVYLKWDGSNYVLPTGVLNTAILKATSRVKIFTGSMDPATVPAVVLGSIDQWIETS